MVRCAMQLALPDVSDGLYPCILKAQNITVLTTATGVNGGFEVELCCLINHPSLLTQCRKSRNQCGFVAPYA